MEHTSSPRRLGGRIAAVEPDSPAAAAGIKAGDRLLAVDGHILRDVIDYRFYGDGHEATFDLRRQKANFQVVVRRSPGQDFGISFAEPLFDGIRRCHAKCFFCFLHGLPKGQRRSLYVKDDDFRLSFLDGNFITLTNLTSADWQRLAEQRPSPLYVSVHATDPRLRGRMLGLAAIPDVREQLQHLGALGIQTHCQVVLCPGVNDGPHLDRTIADLAALFPAVRSVGVVPVGLSQHLLERAHRWRRPERLVPVDAKQARLVLHQIRSWQRSTQRLAGLRFVHAADEFYLLAGDTVPPASHYEDFPQLENGIGMVRQLLADWARVRSRLRQRRKAGQELRLRRPLEATLASGTLIAPLLAQMVAELNEIEGLSAQLVPVINHLFGPLVTVSGLLSGQDIVDALWRHVGPRSLVALPRNALDAAGERFIDDLTLATIEGVLGARVVFVENMGQLLKEILALAGGWASKAPQTVAIS